MINSTFKQKQYQPNPAAPLRPLDRPVNLAKISANDPAPTVVKDNPVRSEAYRRQVAAMPCAHCGKPGRSQHAHENDGKGKGVKLDDRCAMPLCADEPGREGCHTQFDQYRLIPGGRQAHVACGKLWAAQTREAIIKANAWPSKLPLWREA
jgi:hypothetical protein